MQTSRPSSPLWNEVLPPNAAHNDPATAIRKKRAVESDLFFIAEVADRVVGTVMGGYDGHRGWVYAVAVKPEFRRQQSAAASSGGLNRPWSNAVASRSISRLEPPTQK